MEFLRKRYLRGNITFSTDDGPLVTESKIRLLEAIDALGSLTHAARSIPMSYKSAWDAIEQMNRMAACPLVARTVGGKNGGSTALTEQGYRLIALYRTVEQQCQSALQALTDHLHGGGTPLNFRYLLRRQHLVPAPGNLPTAPATSRGLPY